MRTQGTSHFANRSSALQTMVQSRKIVRFFVIVGVVAIVGCPSLTSAEHDDDNFENEADIVYDFSYEVKDAPTGNDFGHRQNRQGLVTQGQYRVLLPDGRMQIVDYVADPTGFQPSIRYQQVFTPDNNFAGTQQSPEFDVAPSNFDASGRQKRRRRRRSLPKAHLRRSHQRT